MPGGQEPQRSEIPAVNPSLAGSRCITTELLSLLPPRETAALLVDTYFDRIHWFMLIFHQQEFRQKWPKLYDTPLEDIVAATPNPAIISTFLVVIAIALQYTGTHRQHLLETQNVISTGLKDRIFSTIRSRLLDIVATGSLEAVQTSVLLGTYYLFHGSPNLAWPVCGCGLRIAQALNLHRKSPTSEPSSPEAQRKIETRKRCWWAIYEIETFCSISYGYPHGIVDTDCNVELLDPLATSSGRSPADYNVIHECPATLLSYKYLMSKLSVILKDVLTDLYGIGSHQSRSSKERSTSLELRGLLRKVPILDDRLQKWKAEIPDILRFIQSTPSIYSSAEEMDRDIGASGPGFEGHLYQLQALALSLAYENARILVHRPLLTYRTTVGREHGSASLSDPSSKTSHLSLQACRDAAMNTSYLGETPIFSLAADTYAAAFISIHTFTAGVMLCVLTSIEPLTPESLQCKLGLRRILNMQAHLKSKAQSPLPAQGLEILERLTRLVMEKELKDILSPRNDSNTQPAGTDARGYADPQALSEEQSSLLQLDMINESAQRGISPDYVEDTTVSQALFDLDQGMQTPRTFWRSCLTPSTVLFGHDLNIPLDHLDTDFTGPSNGITQEQAWIWGVESPMQSFGQK